MNEQIVQMAPMWALAGLGAGWLADAFFIRRGYGLIVDMGLGVGAGFVGGSVFLALFGLPAGMFVMFVVGFVLATGAIFAQRLCWRAAPVRALSEGTTLGHMLVKGLGEHAAGTSSR
jgi:hypothetical protein